MKAWCSDRASVSARLPMAEGCAISHWSLVKGNGTVMRAKPNAKGCCRSNDRTNRLARLCRTSRVESREGATHPRRQVHSMSPRTPVLPKIDVNGLLVTQHVEDALEHGGREVHLNNPAIIRIGFKEHTKTVESNSSQGFAATLRGQCFTGGLRCQARSEGGQPFASSPFVHPIPQSCRLLIQRFLFMFRGHL